MVTALSAIRQITQSESGGSYSRYPVHVTSQSELTIEEFTSWPGTWAVTRGQIDGDDHDALQVRDSDEITVKKFLLGGAVDECLSCINSRGCLFEDGIITRAITLPLHPKVIDQSAPRHDYGMLHKGVEVQGTWGAYGPNVIRRVIFAGLGGRTPASEPSELVEGVTSGELRESIENCLIWNPLSFGPQPGSSNQANHVGLLTSQWRHCVVILTSQSDQDQFKAVINDGDLEHVFVEGCWVWKPDGTLQDLTAFVGFSPGATSEHFTSPTLITDPHALVQTLLEDAGPTTRSAEHQRCIDRITKTRLKGRRPWR